MQKFAKPQIPAGLLHDMTVISPSGSYSGPGGQWKPSETPDTATFKGIVMPLTNEDLQHAPAGTYTRNSQKLYTNGRRLTPGQQFTDPFDDTTYTVMQELTHGPVHPMKRYVVEAKGVASSK